MKLTRTLQIVVVLLLVVTTSTINVRYLSKKVARHDHQLALVGFFVTLALVLTGARVLRQRSGVAASILGALLGHLAGITGAGATMLLDAPGVFEGPTRVPIDAAVLIWIVWPVFGHSWLLGLLTTWGLRLSSPKQPDGCSFAQPMTRTAPRKPAAQISSAQRPRRLG